MRSLQVTWATPVSKCPSFLKYHHGIGLGNFRSVFSLDSRALSDNCSESNRRLLTPMVTLAVGKPPKHLTAHEGFIEKLSFYTTVCEPGYLDAEPRIIYLPSDDPDIMVALMEYLATGSYTYEHENSKEIPDVDLQQVLFHLKLYATAMKYGSVEVAKPALEATVFALAKLNAPDALKIWQVGYNHGFSIEKLVPAGSEGLKKTLKELATGDPTLFPGLAMTHPKLAGDLLKLLVADL